MRGFALLGIFEFCGEKLYLTGVTALRKKAAELDALYEQLPAHRGATIFCTHVGVGSSQPYFVGNNEPFFAGKLGANQ